MKIKDLLSHTAERFSAAGNSNALNEARWLFESVSGMSQTQITLNSGKEVEKTLENEFLRRADERISGKPIQYVIGNWDFCGNTFCVGEGVLIPRPETELLVELAEGYIRQGGVKTTVDLCAGSGCIGLTLAKMFPSIKVYLIEKSDLALEFLKRNAQNLNVPNVEILSGDLFDGFEKFNIPENGLLVSNPPYIRSDVVPTLDKEVLCEPVLALDGGADGLDFYRAIAGKWISHFAAAVVECGEEQTRQVCEIFDPYCDKTKMHIDLFSNPRAVCAIMKGQPDYDF